MKPFNFAVLFFILFVTACSEPQSLEFKGLQDI